MKKMVISVLMYLDKVDALFDENTENGLNDDEEEKTTETDRRTIYSGAEELINEVLKE